MRYTMKSLPVLVSLEEALCGEAPTVVNRNCAIKVGEEDELGVSLHVGKRVGPHCDGNKYRMQVKNEGMERERKERIDPSISQNWGWVGEWVSLDRARFSSSGDF